VPDDQRKVHANPWSHEGLGESVAILRTDIEWIKQMLERLDEKLDKRDEEWKSMFREMREETDGRFKEMEDRITRLEGEVQKLKSDNTKLWATFAGAGAFMAFLEFLKKFLGG